MSGPASVYISFGKISNSGLTLENCMQSTVPGAHNSEDSYYFVLIYSKSNAKFTEFPIFPTNIDGFHLFVYKYYLIKRVLN